MAKYDLVSEHYPVVSSQFFNQVINSSVGRHLFVDMHIYEFVTRQLQSIRLCRFVKLAFGWHLYKVINIIILNILNQPQVSPPFLFSRRPRQRVANLLASVALFRPVAHSRPFVTTPDVGRDCRTAVWRQRLQPSSQGNRKSSIAQKPPLNILKFKFKC